MDDMTTNGYPHPVPPKQGGKTGLVTILIILSLLALGAVAGVYIWQHKKVSDLNTQLNSLKQQSSAQATKITTLEKQLSDSEKASQPNLAVTVNHSSRFALFGASTKDYVAVNVTLKNSSTKVTQINVTDFKLKDDQNNAYKSYRDVLNGDTDNAVIQSSLPSGDTLLTNQSLAAGETVTGSLVYYAKNQLTSFTLVYTGQSYSVSVK